jgi:cytochrome c oxidase subunit III
MNPERSILTAEEREDLKDTMLVRGVLEEQFRDLEQQHHAAALGMWVFLATEVMFFGTLFLGLSVYHYKYPAEFETASGRLNWIIGGINTIVLLVSSLTVVLAVHYAQHGQRGRVVLFLGMTALLGLCFLGFKALEYYIDYKEMLIPAWRFDAGEWVERYGLRPDQVPHVKLFLLFYWIMTAFHALHVTIGVIAVLVMMELARRGFFSRHYYSPVDVTALYWHFVDIVWIFLLPMLYLMSTHRLGQ